MQNINPFLLITGILEELGGSISESSVRGNGMKETGLLLVSLLAGITKKIQKILGIIDGCGIICI